MIDTRTHTICDNIVRVAVTIIIACISIPSPLRLQPHSQQSSSSAGDSGSEAAGELPPSTTQCAEEARMQ